MIIKHIALWTNQLEILKTFYVDYFFAQLLGNIHKFESRLDSYLLSFSSGTQLKLMQIPFSEDLREKRYFNGLSHISFAVGSIDEVDHITNRINKDGYLVFNPPHYNDDGTYKSTVLDPDGNRIEIST